MKKNYICLLLVLLALTGLVEARTRRHSQGGNTPGQFDYYLLVLSWAPDYCAMPNARQNSRECAAGNRVGFVVHGLWPQFNNGAYPKECAPASPVATDIVNRMLAYIPDAGLIQHEWKEHGTCSGLDASTYFGNIRKVFDSVNIPADFKTLTQQIQVSPAAVEDKFAAANPPVPKGAIRVGCGGGQELSDVRICVTKDLKAETCPASERDCPAGGLTMRPER